MSSRTPGRALRIAIVCLAMIASGGAVALAAETTSEVLAPGPDEEARAAPAPEPNATKQAPGKDWLSTVMNAGAIAFCVWMVALLWRPGLGRSLVAAKQPRRPKRG